ncbi:MAG: type II 3-dehydroquinate dehydratase [Hyphomonadaceae bacterium]
MPNPTDKPIFILNGPNLNLLGQREPEVYGRDTLDDIKSACAARAAELGRAIDFRQSNHEGELIDWLHEARISAALVIFNPGAYTHTSVALHDAVKAIAIPVIEIHLSNPASREPFRHMSYVSPVAKGVIAGFGAGSYALALDAADRLLNAK